MSVLVLDKPPGLTSFDVVRQVRGALSRSLGLGRGRSLKVGHGGTLDPLASGVLPVCVGEATKLAPFLLDADKEYVATLRLGAETDTLDADGTIIRESAVGAVTERDVRTALHRFSGTIDQVPPMYSALKRDGRPLHEYAREGHEIERAPRQVRIFEVELLALDLPRDLSFRVRCSKGTYVRVLGADLARSLGTLGHLTALRRTASGPFNIEQAISLQALVDRLEEGANAPFVSLSEALRHLPAVTASDAHAEALRQGKKLPWGELGVEPSRVRVLRRDGSLLAVAEPGAEGRVQTLRVFNREELRRTIVQPGVAAD